MYDEKLFVPPKIKVVTNKTKYIEEKRIINHKGTSIINKTDLYSSLKETNLDNNKRQENILKAFKNYFLIKIIYI